MEAQIKSDRLASLLKADPANIRLRCDCVEAAIEARDFDSALAIADAGLEGHPNDEMLLFGKCNALIGRREYSRATEILSSLQALHPENNAIAQNLALCCYCEADYANARRHLELVYSSGDRSADAIRLLVSSCHHLGLMERAITVADENKEMARRDSALAGVMALAYLDASRAADAARCSAYSLRMNPKCIDALTVDATLRLSAGDTIAAQRTFEALVQTNPSLGRAWIGLGSIAMLRQDFVTAKSDVKRGLESLPGHVGSWHLLGWIHLVAGELDDAESVFEKALDINRNFSETHGALASIAAMRGRMEAAEESIKVALRLDPACLSARFAQSVLAAKAGNPAQAQAIIQQGLATLMGGDGGLLKGYIKRATQTPS